MSQITIRVWDGVLLMLSPGCLIDRILDRIETLSGAIEPAQVDRLPCDEARFRELFD